MKYLFMLLWATQVFADVAHLSPFPVFLRQGFSSILEFEEAPTRVVLGDSQSFQVEKLERSLVVKTLTPYATTNMFVYFKTKEPRSFTLTASEEAEPTYFKKFEPVRFPKKDPPPLKPNLLSKPRTRSVRIISAKFDAKKDYLTIDFEVRADSQNTLRPNWELIRIINDKHVIAPQKLWSERREVQKDSAVKGRLIFVKPKVPKNLKAVTLVIPILGETNPLQIGL